MSRNYSMYPWLITVYRKVEFLLHLKQCLCGFKGHCCRERSWGQLLLTPHSLQPKPWSPPVVLWQWLHFGGSTKPAYSCPRVPPAGHLCQGLPRGLPGTGPGFLRAAQQTVLLSSCQAFLSPLSFHETGASVGAEAHSPTAASSPLFLLRGTPVHLLRVFGVLVSAFWQHSWQRKYASNVIPFTSSYSWC